MSQPLIAAAWVGVSWRWKESFGLRRDYPYQRKEVERTLRKEQEANVGVCRALLQGRSQPLRWGKWTEQESAGGRTEVGTKNYKTEQSISHT